MTDTIKTPGASHARGIKGSPEAERALYGGNHNPAARALADRHDAEHASRAAAGARLSRAKYGNSDRARD